MSNRPPKIRGEVPLPQNTKVPLDQALRQVQQAHGLNQAQTDASARLTQAGIRGNTVIVGRTRTR